MDVLRSPRDVLRARWGKAGDVEQKSADVLDIVTKTDREVERAARSALAKLYPDIAFAGEEFGGSRKEDRFWLMDPIDGTVEFSKGEAGCSSMIALLEHGRVTFAAIYDFLGDEMYWAERGKGAFCNASPIAVSTQDSITGARIIWELDLSKSHNETLYKRLRDEGAVLSRWGAAGMEMVKVARGEYDARISIDPFGMDYDFAPGSLLVSEAGGIVHNVGASQYSYTNLDFIASNASLYVSLQRVVLASIR